MNSIGKYLLHKTQMKSINLKKKKNNNNNYGKILTFKLSIVLNHKII